MKIILKSLKRKILLLIMIMLSIEAADAQKFNADYKPLPSKLLTGAEPVIICILENTSSTEKLYDGLTQDPGVKNKFTIYSTEVLNEYKSILGIEEFNPDDKSFLNAVGDALGVQYLLNWKALPDNSGGYLLTVYSVKKSGKIYEKQFYPSGNSGAVADVGKLLAENLEPVYTAAMGELEIASNINDASHKLYSGGDLVKEWTGNAKQTLEAGNYKLISEASGYKPDEREINIAGEKLTSIRIDLEEDANLLPAISSLDSRLSGLKLERELDKIKISFDLKADKADEYDIEIGLLDKMTKNVIDLNRLSGDYQNVKPGNNKTIIWDAETELGKNFQMKNYEMKISIGKSGGIAWYYFAGGGAALAGGLAAILLGGGGDNGGEPAPQQPQKIGLPPVRP